MNYTASGIPIRQTGSFSKLVNDYTNQAPVLVPFYEHTPNWNGLAGALTAKKNTQINREVLVAVLKEQYRELEDISAVNGQIERLLQPNTFSICTAHQPNIFTGHLYVIYKILHAIKLANASAEQFPGHHFVPVYYMGSEDADLEELGHIFLNGEQLEWNTRQTGAVGRMQVDDAAIHMLNRIAGELEVEAFGTELVQLLRTCYVKGRTIQRASLELFHRLFGRFGLVVLIADHPQLKAMMKPVFSDELFNQRSSALVGETSKKLEAHYRVQAHPRDINLFYLRDGVRERVLQQGDGFEVRNTTIQFTRETLAQELEQHPEHFSPNVILRGLYQETILPNIAFIGGGGELAYWLEFKQLFQHYGVPFPALVLRNSFLVVNEKWQKIITGAGLTIPELFLNEHELSALYVKKQTENPVELAAEIQTATGFYAELKKRAGKTDATLVPHIASLEKKAIQRLQQLEKKLLRAEKRKYNDVLNQVRKMKAALFPKNNLQERVDNFMPGYAAMGEAFINLVYEHSQALNTQFTVIHPGVDD